jgi:hypothetical protein
MRTGSEAPPHPYVLRSSRAIALHFHGGGPRTTAAPPRTFTNSDNMVEIIRRGNGFRDLASKQAVEHAIMAGRGNVDRLLTPEQYARLVG